MFELSKEKPVYLQIAEWLENEILRGNITEGGRLPSQADIADIFDINPMTAGKGVSVLETRGVIEKRRRGCGIYVLPEKRRADRGGGRVAGRRGGFGLVGGRSVRAA